MDKDDATEVGTFDDIDTNKDGFISKDELYRFIKDQRMLHSELFWVVERWKFLYGGEYDTWRVEILF